MLQKALQRVTSQTYMCCNPFINHFEASCCEKLHRVALDLELVILLQLSKHLIVEDSIPRRGFSLLFNILTMPVGYGLEHIKGTLSCYMDTPFLTLAERYWHCIELGPKMFFA